MSMDDCVRRDYLLRTLAAVGLSCPREEPLGSRDAFRELHHAFRPSFDHSFIPPSIHPSTSWPRSVLGPVTARVNMNWRGPGWCSMVRCSAHCMSGRPRPTPPKWPVEPRRLRAPVHREKRKNPHLNAGGRKGPWMKLMSPGKRRGAREPGVGPTL